MNLIERSSQGRAVSSTPPRARAGARDVIGPEGAYAIDRTGRVANRSKRVLPTEANSSRMAGFGARPGARYTPVTRLNHSLG